MILILQAIAVIFSTLAWQVSSQFLPYGIDTEHLIDWSWATSTVVDTWLYIAGGEIQYTQDGSDDIHLIWNNNTLAVDLSKSWSANTVSAVSTPSDDLNVVTRQPTLWYNGFKNKLNLYGGWPYSEDPEPVLVSSATPKRGNVTWSNEFQKGDGSSFSKVTRKFAGLAASSPTAYYNLGGRASSLTDSDFGTYNGWFAMNDLLIFDFATETWINQTVDRYRVLGEAQYIPIFGDQGILVFLGGDEPTSRSLGDWNDLGRALAAMDSITIYDIASKQWYEQKATGTIPEGRFGFCSVVVTDPSNSTYEIYIYGGSQFLAGPTIAADLQLEMGNVYILSIPAFTWKKVPASYPAPWRLNHYCEVVGSRQMLSIGGRHGYDNTKDQFPNGLGIFDMVDLTWTDNYDSNAKAYQRSEIVDSLYTNGTPNVAVTWSDPELRTIFKATRSENTAALTTTTPTSTPTPTPTPTPALSSPPPSNSSTAKKNIAGPVAGGVIGGVAVIAAAIFGICIWRKKKREIGNNRDGPQDEGQAVSDMYMLPERDASKPVLEMYAPTKQMQDEGQSVSDMCISPDRDASKAVLEMYAPTKSPQDIVELP